MLLQPTISTPPPHHTTSSSSLSSSLSYSLSIPSGVCISGRIRPIRARKNPTFTCSSISQVYSYGTVDYEKRPPLNWNGVYKRVSMMENPEMGPSSVLNQCEDEGKRLTKWEINRVVKELRKFRRYKLALEVYEWMNSRGERFRMTTSDTAIELDLIAKVHGISSAEEYFLKLPDSMKDNRIYGALLNAYVHGRMKEKAESLFDKMRNRGYANHALPFNVMMTLYMNLEDYDKVESMIAEMMEKEIPFDVYSYNIWLSSSVSSTGSVDKMEQVFEHMTMNASINPNWTTFSTMATMYSKLGCEDKAEDCLKKLESRITGRDRIPYHYLISLYANLSKKEEVLRVWNVYKSVFPYMTNLGYHAMISSLVRMDDIEAAERIYQEWLQVKSMYDPRIANLLLGWYVRKGFSVQTEAFFNQMIEAGGKPNSTTWEIVAEGHIRERRISNALSCLRNAAEGSKRWKPKPLNVSSILKMCEQDGDMASKEALLGVLKQVGCLEDEVYMSSIPFYNVSMVGDELSIKQDEADNDDDDESEDRFIQPPFQV